MGKGMKQLLKQVEDMHGSTNDYTINLINRLEEMENTMAVTVNSLIHLRMHMEESRKNLLEMVAEGPEDDTHLLHSEDNNVQNTEVKENVKRGRGRPKGSKNKTKSIDNASAAAQ